MNDELFQDALLRVQARRMRAMIENERRCQEIGKKIPQIAEINAQLARTSVRVLEIIQAEGNQAERLQALEKENLQAQAICSQLLQANGYPADYLDMHYTCEKCHDTGYCNNTYCDCLRAEIASVSIARMNRSAQLRLSDFSQFSLQYYRGLTTPDGKDCYTVMKNILEKCRNYALHFSEQSPSLLFYGRTGLGKTHLSLAIAKEVLGKGYEVIYDSIINLLGRIEKEHFGRESSEVDTLSLLLDVDLLILDDLGTEFKTSFNLSTVYNIINTRINRGKPTIISTNLDNKGILQRYEERIVSRLFTVYECHQFVGEDIRMLKKQNGQGNR